MTTRHSVIIGVVVDVCICLAMAALFAFLYFVVEPVQRGFVCGDPSINFPSRPPRIRQLPMFVIGIAICFSTILLFEFISKLLMGRTNTGRYRQFYISVAKLSTMYLYGLILVMLIIQVIKLLTSSPRPDFLATCQPDIRGINCSQRLYIAQYSCTSGASRLELNDARKSFPSGHAGFSVFCATYICLYLEHRYTYPVSVLLKSVLQLASMCFALFCSLSRLVDHKHRASDVIAGALLGSVGAMWTVFCLARHWRRETICKSPDAADLGGYETETVVLMESSQFKRHASNTSQKTMELMLANAAKQEASPREIIYKQGPGHSSADIIEVI